MAKKQVITQKPGRKKLPDSKKKIGVSLYIEYGKVEKYGGRAGAVIHIMNALEQVGSDLLM